MDLPFDVNAVVAAKIAVRQVAATAYLRPIATMVASNFFYAADVRKRFDAAYVRTVVGFVQQSSQQAWREAAYSDTYLN